MERSRRNVPSVAMDVGNPVTVNAGLSGRDGFNRGLGNLEAKLNNGGTFSVTEVLGLMSGFACQTTPSTQTVSSTSTVEDSGLPI